MQLTRREFLCGAVAGGAMLALPRPLRAQGVGSYSVPVLGDIHFDSPDPKFYHANYTHSTSQKRYKAHLAEHVRNSEMWKERLPRLVRASGACLRKDAAFALQMGKSRNSHLTACGPIPPMPCRQSSPRVLGRSAKADF